MIRATINGLHLWQFDNLNKEQSIRHYVSDRNTSGEEFTLSLSSTPDKARVTENRSRLATALGVSPERMYFPSQVHGTRIVVVDETTRREDLLETDALITSTPGVCISVMSADCVPVLLYDRKNHAIGAVHSGWRGTVAKILSLTLDQMRSTFGTSGKDLVAGIGPSVSQESYEVGGEVIDEVSRSFGSDAGLLVRHEPDKARLDLWKANRLQLLEFGVSEDNIEISDLCTVRHNQHFFSARRGDSGRFAAGIVLL